MHVLEILLVAVYPTESRVSESVVHLRRVGEVCSTCVARCRGQPPIDDDVIAISAMQPEFPV